jgi:hypothetical protein
MPLNPIPVGDAIAALVKSSAPAPGTPITDAKLKELWEGIITLIYTDLKTNGIILPGTFTAPPLGGPVTGAGEIS